VNPEPIDIQLERARHRGREAFHAGNARTECPYDADTAEHAIWTEAWDTAEHLRQGLGEHWARQA
jgi:ribosome modulation factor